MNAETKRKALEKFEKARQMRLEMLKVSQETLGTRHEVVKNQISGLKALEKVIKELENQEVTL